MRIGSDSVSVGRLARSKEVCGDFHGGGVVSWSGKLTFVVFAIKRRHTQTHVYQFISFILHS